MSEMKKIQTMLKLQGKVFDIIHQSKQLDFIYTSTSRILRKNLDLRPYKIQVDEIMFAKA